MVLLKKLLVVLLAIMSIDYFATAMEHLISFRAEEAVSGLILLAISFWLGTITIAARQSGTPA